MFLLLLVVVQTKNNMFFFFPPQDLVQEVSQLRNKVDELEEEKSNYERKLRVTKVPRERTQRRCALSWQSDLTLLCGGEELITMPFLLD